MAENKTKITDVSPRDFIKNVDGEEKRKDATELVKLMSEVTGHPPKMWGPSIIGFGKRRYKYTTGREGEICMIGFSPRNPSLVLYVGDVLQDEKLMSCLGKHKTGKGCLYISKLADVDRAVLKQVLAKSVAHSRKNYDCD